MRNRFKMSRIRNSVICWMCAGKYLGGHQEFNRAVLTEFVRCHEFTQLLLVQALRQFLWSFR
jgi:Sec7-like guanine-nucleotide exchange factor